MPSDLIFKTMNRAHRLLLAASGGRIGWSAYKMPVLQLTTIGRRSGQARTTMLTSPYQEGSTIVVVASAGGEDHHPAWYLNVRDQPEVTVALRGEAPKPMRATVADAPTRERLWPIITSEHANYAGYQRKTDREIPLVLLNPIEG